MFPRAIFHSVDPHYSHSSVVRPFAFRGVDGRPPDERPLRIHRLRVLQLHPGRIATPLRRCRRPRCLIQKRKEDGRRPSFDRLNGRCTVNKIGNSCEEEEEATLERGACSPCPDDTTTRTGEIE